MQIIYCQTYANLIKETSKSLAQSYKMELQCGNFSIWRYYTFLNNVWIGTTFLVALKNAEMSVDRFGLQNPHPCMHSMLDILETSGGGA